MTAYFDTIKSDSLRSQFESFDQVSILLTFYFFVSGFTFWWRSHNFVQRTSYKGGAVHFALSHILFFCQCGRFCFPKSTAPRFVLHFVLLSVWRQMYVHFTDGNKRIKCHSHFVPLSDWHFVLLLESHKSKLFSQVLQKNKMLHLHFAPL